MFAEPLNAYIVDGVTAIACRAINRGDKSSLYKSADGNTEVFVSTIETKAGRARHTIKVTTFKNVLDPLVSSTVYKRVSLSTSYTVDRPIGATFSTTDVVNATAGIKLMMTTAMATGLYAYES